MHLKIGLAAGVFAAVGTFAVAEGVGEGQGGCGDGGCWVGTALNHTLYELGLIAGHKESEVGSRYQILSGFGIVGPTFVVGNSYFERETIIIVDTTGNCNSGVGQNSGVGCN